ncbi:MAG TPA: hypothetical protein DEB40_05245 [Elusimicrobia bacterium]|nr:hypothetical protein [Elusimicrobiota bacterium]HBT61130.1 hypothetical protein [Elusimicrobiota bacterium]
MKRIKPIFKVFSLTAIAFFLTAPASQATQAIAPRTRRLAAGARIAPQIAGEGSLLNLKNLDLAALGGVIAAPRPMDLSGPTAQPNMEPVSRRLLQSNPDPEALIQAAPAGCAETAPELAPLIRSDASALPAQEQPPHGDGSARPKANNPLAGRQTHLEAMMRGIAKALGRSMEDLTATADQARVPAEPASPPQLLGQTAQRKRTSARSPRRRHRQDFEAGILKSFAARWRTSDQIKLIRKSPPPDGKFSFAVIGDAEPGRFWFARLLFNKPGMFWKLLKQALSLPADFTVQLGDMVSRGRMPDYLGFIRRLAAADSKRPYLTVIGNHDRRAPHHESDSRLYRAAFGRNNYHFDYGGVRFVVLDTSKKKLSVRQLQWLDQALDTDQKKIVFTHMPPAPLHLWSDFLTLRGAGGFKKGAPEFTAIVSRRRVDRVYLGHIHGYGVTDYLGVRYVLTGGGGSPLYPTKAPHFYHFLTVTVGPDGIVDSVHPLR